MQGIKTEIRNKNSFFPKNEPQSTDKGTFESNIQKETNLQNTLVDFGLVKKYTIYKIKINSKQN